MPIPNESEARVAQARLAALRESAAVEPQHEEGAENRVPESAEEARAAVFAHWHKLDAQCQRRFPRAENVAHEGLLYVLDRLESNGWERVRAWEGLGNFATFLATLTARLLTDFTRAKYGHVRAPAWLTRQQDPLWHAAYRLVAIQRQERRDAVELLVSAHPSRERDHIEAVVATVAGRCRRPMHYSDGETSTEDVALELSHPTTIDEDLVADQDELSDALARCLGSAEGEVAATTERVEDLLERLRPHVTLSEEDRVLLRLRFMEGVKMTQIVKMQTLEGDPYKRFNRIFARLRVAFNDAGLHGA